LIHAGGHVPQSRPTMPISAVRRCEDGVVADVARPRVMSRRAGAWPYQSSHDVGAEIHGTSGVRAAVEVTTFEVGGRRVWYYLGTTSGGPVRAFRFI
jgi:hypothetical protein